MDTIIQRLAMDDPAGNEFYIKRDDLLPFSIGGNKVRIVGFGIFDSKERVARKGVNPRTGESMIIESAKIPTFKAGSEFRNMLK